VNASAEKHRHIGNARRGLASIFILTADILTVDILTADRTIDRKNAKNVLEPRDNSSYRIRTSICPSILLRQFAGAETGFKLAG